MKKFNTFLSYIFWCGGHLNYKTFGEDGHTGITLIVLNIVFLIGNFVSLIRVIFFGHTKFITTNIFDLIAKGFIAFLILIFYYYFENKFKNKGIKYNKEFSQVKRSKRVRDTFFIFIFLIFQFYIFLVFMSPSFKL